jgi:serine/threonine protein kinase
MERHAAIVDRLTSALVFRIVVRGCPYLLRVIASTDATAGPGPRRSHTPVCLYERGGGGCCSVTHAVDGFVRKFQAAKILPESETEELFQGYARVASVYPRHDSDMVSSHNDLKPENILFDGDRVWLVDWEAAFLNDRYHDLAVVANFVVTNDAEEEAYLRTYFGEAAGEVSLVTQEAKLQYARVHMNRILENMRAVRFQDALRIVSDRQASA